MSNHRFNNDLLNNEGDLDQAGKLFPTVLHVLDHEELRSTFESHDIPANRAKRSARQRGIVAILFGTTALLGTASEPLYHGLEGPAPQLIACISAILGVAGVIIGLRGFLLFGRKTEWLKLRLMTERLRQFHFQTFVCRIPQIVESLADPNRESAQDAYRSQREKWFTKFSVNHEGALDSALQNLLDDDAGEGDAWLHNGKTPEEEEIPYDRIPDDLFAAYRQLRIKHQINYANWQLRLEGFFVFSSPRMQLRSLTKATLICVVLLFVIHMIIAVAIPAGLPLGSTAWPHVLALWIAIGALSCRALEEGLKPRQEIERYRDYRSNLLSILERFDSAADPETKVEMMREMERLSFEEMKSFLRTADEAQFVL